MKNWYRTGFTSVHLYSVNCHYIISIIKVGIKGSITVLHNLSVRVYVNAFMGNDLVFMPLRVMI